MTANTACCGAAGEVRGVVDPDRVAAGTPPTPGTAGAPTGPPRPLAEPGRVQRERAARWPARPTPGAGSCRGARACDASGRPRPTARTAQGSRSPPRAAARAPRCPASSSRQPRVAPASPPPRPPLVQLQIGARAAVLPAAGDGLVDQLQQRRLGGRIDAARDRATQSQRSFPSASINRTPISFNASDSRAISALASAQLGIRSAPGEPPVGTPRAHPARPAWRPSEA